MNLVQQLARALLYAVAVAIALASHANARVYTGNADLPAVWRDYQAQHAHVQPGIDYPYAECFRRAALVNQLPQTLLIAVARGESDFDTNARSHANAHGLMQILWPGTARHLGLNLLSELYEPCKNVDAGARYLKELLALYDNNMHLAIAAYNYGPHRIKADRPMPDGAKWYSGYIYRHLQYVLSRSGGTRDGAAPGSYLAEGKTELIVFREPYRAAAFVQTLEQRIGDVRLDWFRAAQARYRVVLLHDSKAEYQRSRARLALAGFALPLRSD